MGQIPDLQEARRRLGLALRAVRHDRWVLGFLRGGSVQPIAASEASRRFLHGRALLPLARRALYERKPVAINSLFDRPAAADGYNWELDWPALLYAPVLEIGQRPIGLLTIGCRLDHWYTDEDIAYARTLGMSLTSLVASWRGPLSRLNEKESEVVQLLSYGLSTPEIAHAIRTDDRRAKALVVSVKKKLDTAQGEVPVIQTW